MVHLNESVILQELDISKPLEIEISFDTHHGSSPATSWPCQDLPGLRKLCNGQARRVPSRAASMRTAW